MEAWDRSRTTGGSPPPPLIKPKSIEGFGEGVGGGGWLAGSRLDGRTSWIGGGGLGFMKKKLLQLMRTAYRHDEAENV